MPQTIFTYESIFADAIVQLATFSLPDGGPFVFDSIQFVNGVQQVDDLSIKPLAGVPDFSAIEFRISAPVGISLKKDVGEGEEEEVVINEHVPTVYVRVVLYTPLRKPDQSPDMVVESRCQTISDPVIMGAKIQLAINHNVVIRLSSRQQLVVPSLMGSRFQNEISEKPAGRTQSEACEKFIDPAKTQFPKDFFNAGADGKKDPQSAPDSQED